MRGAERLRGDDEFAPRQRQRRSARHPHEGGNAEHAEDEGEIEDRLPDKGDHGQHENKRRKGQQHVHGCRRRWFGPAAEIASEHAERATEQSGR